METVHMFIGRIRSLESHVLNTRSIVCVPVAVIMKNACSKIIAVSHHNSVNDLPRNSSKSSRQFEPINEPNEPGRESQGNGQLVMRLQNDLPMEQCQPHSEIESPLISITNDTQSMRRTQVVRLWALNNRFLMKVDRYAQKSQIVMKGGYAECDH
jgi:hypothetical protein